MSIKLIEPYHITQTRKDVRDAMMMTGEMCILLQCYHPSNDPDAARCQVCYNAVYKQAKEYDCPHCYGTTYEIGIKEAARVWGVFTQDDNDEPVTKHGVWDSNQRTAQFEAYPLLTQRDYVVRVSRWSKDYVPQAIDGVYQVGPVKVTTIRTGGGFDDQNYAAVGQVAQLSKMPLNSPIYRYQVIGKSFAENANVALNELPPVVSPDTKVVYFPISGPSTENPNTPIFDADGFSFVQAIPAATWTVPNPMGRMPAAVTVYINGEVWEADEEYPDVSTILLHFGEPVAGRVEVV